MGTTAGTIDHTALARLVEAGAVRNFRKFETLVRYLRELGIYQYRVNAADFDPQALKVSRVRPDASKRMRSAFEAKAHADWISEKVAESLTDPRPNITHAQVMAKAQALIDSKRAQHASKAKA